MGGRTVATPTRWRDFIVIAGVYQDQVAPMRNGVDPDDPPIGTSKTAHHRHRGSQIVLHPCHTTRRAGPHRAVRVVEVMRGVACHVDQSRQSSAHCSVPTHCFSTSGGCSSPPATLNWGLPQARKCRNLPVQVEMGRTSTIEDGAPSPLKASQQQAEPPNSRTPPAVPAPSLHFSTQTCANAVLADVP